jgi:hypothetical protein
MPWKEDIPPKQSGHPSQTNMIFTRSQGVRNLALPSGKTLAMSPTEFCQTRGENSLVLAQISFIEGNLGLANT